MARCSAYFNAYVEPEDSSLFRDLKKVYTQGAEYIYFNIIKSDEETSDFRDWLSNQGDFQLTPEEEPAIEVFNDWITDVITDTHVNKNFKTDKVNTTTEEFTNISEGLTAYIADVLKEKGFTFNDIVDKHVRVDNIFNRALDRTLLTLDERVKIARNDSNSTVARLNTASRIELISNEIDANRYLFQRAYDAYLHSMMGITIINPQLSFGIPNTIEGVTLLNDELETTEDEQDKDTKDTAFDKSAMEFSTKENAPNAIKLLIASLKVPNQTNDYSLPKLVDYNDTFNFLHHTLAPIPADINLYVKELKKFTALDKRPELQGLIDQISFDKKIFRHDQNKDKAFREQELRTQFVNQFDKTLYTYTLHKKNEDGSYSVLDANFDNAQNQRVRDWENNFKQLIEDNPKVYSVDNFDVIKKLPKTRFLKAIGIDIDPTFVTNKQLDSIKNHGIPTWDAFLTIYNKKKKNEVIGQIRNIAKKAVFEDVDIVELSHYNAEGKLVYGISLNTYLSSKVKNLAYYRGNQVKLAELYPYLSEGIYARNSHFNNLAQAGYEIGIAISTGFKNDNNSESKDTSKLSYKDIHLQKIYNILQEGHYNFPRAADRKVENTLFFKDRKFQDGLIVQSKESMKIYLVNHLVDEIALNDYYASGSTIKNLRGFDKTNTRVFMLNDGTNLLKSIGLEGKTADELLDMPKIEKFLDAKIDEIIQAEKDYFEKHNITAGDVKSLATPRLYGDFNNIIETFALNSFLGNLEITKMFTGDPYLYKDPNKPEWDEFFKRMNMLNSTKESTRTDEEMDEYIFSLTHNSEVKNGYTAGRIDSTVQTVTLRELISNMTDYSQDEKDAITDILGDIKEYSDIKDADGFAVITYDEYRIMRMRYNNWSGKDEALYQRLTTETDPAIGEEYYNMIKPNKSQSVGSLVGETELMLGGRKFAFMPLVPGLFKQNSILDKLNKQMLGKGIGMGFFESASKFGNQVGEDNKAPLDISTGDFQITDDVIDVLNYENIGNQIALSTSNKFQLTESTQKRKLNMMDFFKNGNISGELKNPKEMADKLEVYNNIQREKVNRALSRLKSQLGIGAKLEDINKFVSSLVSMGRLQGFTTNELKALQYLLELPYFDALSNKTKVEHFVMARLKNNVITQKRTGQSLAQMSNAGFNLPGGENDLRFYRFNKDKELLPMEVYAPLPRNLIEYVQYHYGDGQEGLTREALNKFNKEIQDENITYEETGEIGPLTRLTLYSGFRIPYQGAASAEVMKVKAFYPPHMGSMVILPKAITKKTGSDYDIDKMNIYMPDFRAIKDSDNKIAEKFIKDGISEYSMRETLDKEDHDVTDLSSKQIKRLFIDEILNHPNPEKITDVLTKVFVNEYKNLLRDKTPKLVYNSVKHSLSPQSDLTSLTDSELNNVTLENEIDVTLSKDNWEQLLKPLGDSNLQKLKKTIHKMIDYKSDNNPSNILTGWKNTDKMIEFQSGKTGIPQAAIHNTNHILSQIAGLYMTNPHDYFGMSEIMKQTDKLTVSEDINEIAVKPEFSFEFLERNDIISNFKNATKVRANQEKLRDRSDELEKIINCIWT